jgi:hypothetical protein
MPQVAHGLPDNGVIVIRNISCPHHPNPADRIQKKSEKKVLPKQNVGMYEVVLRGILLGLHTQSNCKPTLRVIASQ